MQKSLTWSQNSLTRGKNSVMDLFSIENVYLFPEVTVGVKWIFCYKEGILMETSVPSKFMLDTEYSVIKTI